VLTTHRLPTPQFTALAQGGGDYGGELLAGQVSKRVLQLLAIRQEIRANHPDRAATRHFVAGYQLLAVLRKRSPDAVDAVLGHPPIGAWAAQTIRRLLDRAVDPHLLDDDLGHLAAIALAAALTAGEGLDLRLRVRVDGTVMVPLFGLARLAAPRSWPRARVEPGAAALHVELPGETVEIPVLSTVSTPRWWPVRRLASTAAGQRIGVRLDDVDPYRDNHRLGAADRLAEPEIGDWQAALDHAWARLVRRHPDRTAALSSGIATLVPLGPGPRPDERSGSSSEMCGAVALTRPADGGDLAATLVHEFQHTKLSALIDLIQLQDDRAASNSRYAPWRTDPRPLPGLLHGAYAYLGLVDYWQVERFAGQEPQNRATQFEFARWRQAVRQALLTLDASKQLTTAGERFVAGMRRRLADLQDRRVPAEPAFLAREALADHWTRWRLHNLRPDPGEIAACAEAWLERAACPPVAPRRPAVHAGPQSWSGRNGRLELAYQRLRDPARFEALPGEPTGSANRGDLAYAGGDYQAAAVLYEHALAVAPDDLDTWAGLMLACRRDRDPGKRFLLAHPEFVQAVHQRVAAVTGAPPGVLDLASWLADGYRAGRHDRVRPGQRPRPPAARSRG
jgi:HEXXH motif-containing protein